MTSFHDHDEWASSALWVVSRTITLDEISERMGQANQQRWPQRHEQARITWIARPVLDDQVPLSEQLDSMERFIAEKFSVLEGLSSECEITLRLGLESPREEERVRLKPSLSRLLGQLNVVVDFGVYRDDDDTWKDDSDDDGST